LPPARRDESVCVANHREPNTPKRAKRHALFSDAVSSVVAAVLQRCVWPRRRHTDALAPPASTTAVPQDARAGHRLSVLLGRGDVHHVRIDDIAVGLRRCTTAADRKSQKETSHRIPFTMELRSNHCPPFGTASPPQTLASVSNQRSQARTRRRALSCRAFRRR